MKHIKICMIFLILIAFILVLSGCTRKSLEAKALDYLQSHYPDDTFSVLSCIYGGLAYSYDEVWCHSDNYNKDFQVRIDEDGNIKSFRDNYYQLYMLADAEEYFYSFVEQYNKDSVVVKVIFDSATFSDSMPKTNSTFEEWVNSGKCWIDIYYLSSEAFSQEEQDYILDNIAPNIFGKVSFYEVGDVEITKDMDLYDIIGNSIHYKDFLISKNEYYIGEGSSITPKDN
ncbi:MAG: hypothetical protein IJ593_06260 [Lachnospiraceae bacterium]|nr:hypothetical protein [Lachnospiraceae bacterium]